MIPQNKSKDFEHTLHELRVQFTRQQVYTPAFETFL